MELLSFPRDIYFIYLTVCFANILLQGDISQIIFSKTQQDRYIAKLYGNKYANLGKSSTEKKKIRKSLSNRNKQ